MSVGPWQKIRITGMGQTLVYWRAPCAIQGCKRQAEAKEWIKPAVLRNISPRCPEHVSQ